MIKATRGGGVYAITLMLALNTALVACLMRTGVPDFNGWPLWRLSLIFSAFVVWRQWKVDPADSLITAWVMVMCWACLPAVWVMVAFWNWGLPDAGPTWLIATSTVSTLLGMVMTWLAER